MSDEQEPQEIELKLEHEITFDIGILPFIAFVLVCFWIGSFDTEIRCALGSEKACASLRVDRAKAAALPAAMREGGENG
jgi:hypothetical protein